MTVSSTTNKATYSGNGTTTAFTVPFYFLAAADLQVILRTGTTETVQTLTTNYTVTGAGVTSGGTVTMLVAPAAGTTLTILRNIEATQETDLVPNDRLPAETLEVALDKATMLIQQLDEEAGRSLKFPASDAAMSAQIPAATARASKFLTFDANGLPTATIGTDATTDIFTQTGAGAVPRSVVGKLQESVSITDYGAVAGGGGNNATAIKNALESGAQRVYVPPGVYAIASVVSITIATDVTFFGHGTFIFTGSSGTGTPMIAIETGNNSFTVDGLSFDGDNKVSTCLRVYNSATPSSNTLPNCVVSNCSFIRFRMTVIGLWNEAVYVAGSFQLVTIANNRVRLITRSAGTGTPGSTGTTGIAVSTLSSTQFVRECVHNGNQYSAIFGDDASGAAGNVDYDAFKFFAPDPTTDGNQFVQSTVLSYGNVYRNCRGRALKIQAIGTVRDETIIRDDGYTITGGSAEINFQYGVGMVSNCQFIYRAYSGGTISPIAGGVDLVSFYQGADYSNESGACIVSGLQVFNSIPSGVSGSGIGAIVEAMVGSTSIKKKLISVSNVSVNQNAVDFIAKLGYGSTVYGTLRLDNITVPALTYSAIGTNGTDTNFDIVATNLLNIDGVSTPANAKPFVTSTAGAALNYGGMVTGALNQGFIQYYSVKADNSRAPLLAGGALSDPKGALGGAASVQSVELADDASHTFDQRFWHTNRGLLFVSVSFEFSTQGVFACGSDQIHEIAVPGTNLFSASLTGSNPDVDGDVNLWFTGGKLNVKNRLGSSRVFTVMFVG